MKKNIITLIITLLALPLNLMAADMQVSLAWDASPSDPYEYQVFCRESGQNYNYGEPAWQGDSQFSQCIIAQLDTSKQYYFVARAVAEDGSQSYDSNEVAYPSGSDGGSDGGSDSGGDDRSAGGGGSDSGILGSSCFINALFSN